MAFEVELLITFLRDFIIFLAIYLIVALSLNLESGYGGVPNFGKVLAVAAGAFTVGFFPGRLAAWLFNIGTAEYNGLADYATLDYHVTIVTEVNKVLEANPALSIAIFFVTLIVAALVGAALGYVASYPAIRLREDYLAIMLLAMGEAIRVIGHNYTPIIRGNIGALVPDPFGWAGDIRYMVVLLFIVGVCLIVLFYLERLVRTPLGRMLRATRDNENVAESLGKDVTRIRMKVIIIASMIGAIAGALDAFKAGGVIATMYHRQTWTFWPWVMVILGGAANNTGIVVGAFAFTSLRRLIDYFKRDLEIYVPFNVVWLEPLILGIMLILILMYRPGGLIPEKPTPTLSGKKLKKIVSSKAVSSSEIDDAKTSG
jgi:branched-chain amino acid transport system permease protein